MILVDTSVWVAWLGRRPRPEITPDEALSFLTCGPVVQEVLQGLRDSEPARAFREAFLALPCLSDPVPRGLFMEAAEIYRQGRRRGYTIRSSTDCLIAAIALANRTPVLHKDRDYSLIARYTPLEVRELAG